MKPGFCYFSEHSQVAASFRDVVQSLAQAGMALKHPTLNRITHVLADGDTSETDRDKLIQLSERSDVVVPFWLDADTSLVVSFCELAPGLSRHLYTLDGLDAGQRAKVQAWGVRHFEMTANAGLAQVLSIDPDGATVDVDWDAVALAGAAPVSIRFSPALVGIPSSWRSHWRFMQEVKEERLPSGFTLIAKA